MAKSDLPISGDYAPVADRIQLFYERFPRGQILSQLVSRKRREILFVARVYRDPADTRPSATGWASERIGDGDVNSVACVENTETSAVGRALANLGFTASRNRPSAEEMAKVARERARQSGAYSLAANAPSAVRVVREGATALHDDPIQRRANEIVELLALLDLAEREGLRPARADPEIERFISEDPLGLQGGINLYAYSGNDPINGSDPSGLSGTGTCLSWAMRLLGSGPSNHYVVTCSYFRMPTIYVWGEAPTWDHAWGQADRGRGRNPRSRPRAMRVQPRVENCSNFSTQLGYCQAMWAGIRQMLGVRDDAGLCRVFALEAARRMVRGGQNQPRGYIRMHYGPPYNIAGDSAEDRAAWFPHLDAVYFTERAFANDLNRLVQTIGHEMGHALYGWPDALARREAMQCQV